MSTAADRVRVSQCEELIRVDELGEFGSCVKFAKFVKLFCLRLNYFQQPCYSVRSKAIDD